MHIEKEPQMAATKGHGRPRGAQHDVTFSVRLPRPTLEALKELARLEKCKVSQAIRAGIIAQIAKVVPQLVATAENPDRAASRRLKAIQRLRLFMRADLYLSPVGLQLARGRALNNPPTQKDNTRRTLDARD